MDKTNGQKPKTDVALNQSRRLKLLRDEPITGKNSYGPYFLYPCLAENGTEESFFAPEPLHEIIKSNGLRKGSEFVLSRTAAGNGGLRLSILGMGSGSDEPRKPDNFRDIMRQCIVDAIELKKSIEGIDLTHEDLRSLSSCLFIARTKQF